ncbi:MAG: hypothetical protein KF887_07080 [Paracoccaceae bacterium]|nr:MAG: hypothetical protein KF887_07080 [Paracoccaceae bacterium]
MTDIFDRARQLIDAAATHPDPEAAMRALEREASVEDRAMFPALWEALVLKLNELPPEGGDADDPA